MSGVYKAIAAITLEMSKDGIGKDRKNQQQGYNFRGIDDVYNSLSPMLARNGLCILPYVLERDCVERQSAKGGALFYVTCKVRFDFVAAEDGSKHEVITYGEAMDSGDKATNKAMSAAFKYACMQAFCIPTEGDNDADAHTHEVVPTPNHKSVPREVFDSMPLDVQTALRDLAMEVTLLTHKGDYTGAYEHIEDQKLDAESKTGLWALLDSKQRSELKKISTTRKAA